MEWCLFAGRTFIKTSILTKATEEEKTTAAFAHNEHLHDQDFFNQLKSKQNV